MRKSSLLTALIFAAGFAGSVLATEVATQVSPSTINLASAGLEVTIHAEVLYSDVLPDTLGVALVDAAGNLFDAAEGDALYIATTFADNQGHLVMKIDWEKFLATHVKEVALGVAKFDIDGQVLVQGSPDPFQGDDTVRIINVGK